MPAIIGKVTDTPVAFANSYIPSLSVGLEARLDAEAFGGRRLGLERRDGQILSGRLDLHVWPLLVMESDADGAEAVAFFTADGSLKVLTS